MAVKFLYEPHPIAVFLYEFMSILIDRTHCKIMVVSHPGVLRQWELGALALDLKSLPEKLQLKKNVIGTDSMLDDKQFWIV